MDLVSGAKKVYVATSHTDKKGKSKLLKKCKLPLTAVEAVDVIVTEFALIRKLNGKMTLCEVSPDVTIEQVLEHTEMELALASPIVPMDISD